MTEADIKRALAIKHGSDFCIDRVKTGPTYDNDKLRILDFWAMKKSWANAPTICYEIKVSKSDFNNDTKWPEYLPYADKFYFAVPKNLITVDDVIAKATDAGVNPDHIGLIYIHGLKYTRIKKDCTDRRVEIPEEFYRYVLMNKIWSDRIPFYNTKKEYLRAWLNDRRDDKDIGSIVRNKMGWHIWEQASEIERLKGIVSRVERISGLKLNSWADVRKIDKISLKSG
jgi:hypothetical protein